MHHLLRRDCKSRSFLIGVPHGYQHIGLICNSDHFAGRAAAGLGSALLLCCTHLGFLKVFGMAVMPPGSGCLLPSVRLLPCTCSDASDSTQPGTLLDTTWKLNVAWWRPSACKCDVDRHSQTFRH
jgi:hypothetical protein